MTDGTCVKDGFNNPRRVIAASSKSIQIQSDTDGDGKCTATGEKVTYALSSSTITRNGPTNPLVKNVVVPSGSDFLTYYQAGSTVALTHPISDPSTIKRIKIIFSVQVPDPTPEGKTTGRTVTSSLSSSVEFRN